jgi:hypothetical protein
MTRRSNRSRGGKNAISNVRIVDQNAGSDGTYIDRCIDTMQNSHSQITILCQDTFAIGFGTSVNNGILAGPQIALFDEFASMAAQFETFRIRAIRYDIYDVNPSSAVVGFFSTFHDQFAASVQPVFSQANVIDGPDSQTVPPGIGKVSLYWRAHGVLENQFVTSDQGGINLPIQYFGGLRYSIAAGASIQPRYQVVVKALVDFRGRL